jgi:hypothetical protein
VGRWGVVLGEDAVADEVGAACADVAVRDSPVVVDGLAEAVGVDAVPGVS